MAHYETDIRMGGEKGFTLFETIIVIAILTIISVFIVVILNPAETLRKTRDSQRLSDLRTLHRALGFFITAKSDIKGGDLCGGGDFNPAIHISFPKDKKGIDIPEGQCPTPLPPLGSPLTAFAPNWRQVLTNDLYRINGGGWISVDFASITGGSPIATLPVDPINSINVPRDLEGDDCVDDDDLVYRYTCFKPQLSFEIDARLESGAFAERALNDGGTNSARYEAGTVLNLLP